MNSEDFEFCRQVEVKEHHRAENRANGAARSEFFFVLSLSGGFEGKKHRSVMMGGFRVLDNINLPCWRVVEGGGRGAWYQYLASRRSLLFLSTYLSGATVTRVTHVTSPIISLPS